MNRDDVPIAVIRLGRVAVTGNALATLTDEDIQTAIRRHQAGDWGDLDDHDRQVNDAGLINGERLFSVYHSTQGVKFYVITEWDRSATTVLLPQDY